MEQHDIDLIKQAQRGSMTAFETIVKTHDRQVLTIAARFTHCADDAKDIYQEVFYRVYKSLPTFKFESEFSTWLFRIATNVCLTHRAQRKRETHQSLDDNTDGEESDSWKQLPASENGYQSRDHAISIRIDMALNTLSPQQRMVFTLKHHVGYKLREIATIMNCAEGTVKKYLFTAIRRLREQLHDIYDEQPNGMNHESRTV